MANVFLTDEAYARLKAAKKKKQSFSDVVMEQVKTTIDLKEFFGSCKGINAEKLYETIKKERKR